MSNDMIEFGAFIYSNNCGVPMDKIDRNMIEKELVNFRSIDIVPASQPQKYFGGVTGDSHEQSSGEGSESYWKKRCEAAEEIITQFEEATPEDSPSFYDGFQYLKHYDAYHHWQQLKSSIGEETNKTENHE